MGVESLTTHGTGMGFLTWTLSSEIEALGQSRAEKLVERSQVFLEVYGPYNGGVPNFGTLIVELVYYTAEALHYWNDNVRAIVSPMRAERIGSYSYDKGDQAKRTTIVEDNELIWPLIMHLKDRTKPFLITTRVVHVLDPSIDSGIRDIVLAYTNRTARAIKTLGLVSDTQEFNEKVYGDRALGWS